MLKNPTLSSFLRYIVSAVSSLGLNLLGTAFCHEILRIDEHISFAIVLVLVFFFNFFMMRQYVCRSQQGDIRRQMVIYAASSLMFRGMEYLGFTLLHSVFSVQYIIAIFTTLCLTFVIKFFYYRSVVFGPRH